MLNEHEQRSPVILCILLLKKLLCHRLTKINDTYVSLNQAASTTLASHSDRLIRVCKALLRNNSAMLQNMIALTRFTNPVVPDIR